jgi:hypothetical protein
MSKKQAILKSFGSLLRTQPTTGLWLLSLVMATENKSVIQRVLAKHTGGALIREMRSDEAAAPGSRAPEKRTEGVRPQRFAMC